MHLFIPYFDAVRIDRALREARRIVRTGDCVTVMVSVIAPADRPIDVGAGEIWKRVCQAECRLSRTQEAAERILPRGVHLRCVRVQARDQTSAILVGVETDRADSLMLTLPDGIRGALAMRFSTIPAVIRRAPCNVRFVGTATPPEARSSAAAPDTVTPLLALQIIAVNPALAKSGTEKNRRETEGKHAS